MVIDNLPAQQVATGDVTREGERLVAAFLGAQERLQRAKREVTSAECDLSTAERALAKWLMPSDMKPGEKIAVWVGDSLFQVELAPREAFDMDGGKHVDHQSKVTIRTRGKEFGRLRA